jgi:hypothetical protein
MSKRAEEFLDAWFQANIADRTLTRRMTLSGLVNRCRTAARKQGVPIPELEEVVGDLEQAIADEITIKKGSPSRFRAKAAE